MNAAPILILSDDLTRIVDAHGQRRDRPGQLDLREGAPDRRKPCKLLLESRYVPTIWPDPLMPVANVANPHVAGTSIVAKWPLERRNPCAVAGESPVCPTIWPTLSIPLANVDAAPGTSMAVNV